MADLHVYFQKHNMFYVDPLGSRVNCFAHILNLAVQDFIKALNQVELDLDLAGISEEEEDEWDQFGQDPKGPTTNILKKVSVVDDL